MNSIFRSLVHEQHDQVHLGVVLSDRVGDLFQNGRLSGFRRTDDHAALSFTDRRYEIDDARRDVLWIVDLF